MKELLVIPIEIVVDEKKVILVANCEELFARVFQVVFLITPGLSAQRAKRAAEIAVPAGFDVANVANPMSKIKARGHLLGYGIGAKYLSGNVT